MQTTALKNARRVLLVQWKERDVDTFEVFSNLLLFCQSYPQYNYNTLNNYISKAKTVFENDFVRVERKELLTRPVPHPVETNMFRMSRVVRRTAAHGYDEKAEDLVYWLSKPAKDRLAAVTFISMGDMGWKKKMDRTFYKIRKVTKNGTK
jgi:hypothetical protein